MLTNDERDALRALARMKVANGSAFAPDVVLALLDALDAETARADYERGQADFWRNRAEDRETAQRASIGRLTRERDEARAEVERLRREVDAIAESHREWERRAREAEAFAAGMERGREALLAECDALRADVERLRHVRNPAADPAPRWGRCPNCGVEHTGDDCMEGKHRHVPDPYMLAGIEAHHVESTETPGWCANVWCGQGWPCVPKKMADEVRRETERADAAEARVAAVFALCDATDVKAAQVSGHALDKVTAKVSTRVVRATIRAIDGGAS